MATHAWFPFVPMPPQAPPSEQEEDSPLENSGSMKDEMIHLYLNNSTMVLAILREACLLGAPRCHGIGMLVGAFGICKEQEQVREAILEERLMLTAFSLNYSELHAGEGVLGVQSVMQMQRWPNYALNSSVFQFQSVMQMQRWPYSGRQTATEEADEAATERAGDMDGDKGGGQGGDARGGIATRLRATESDLMRCGFRPDAIEPKKTTHTKITPKRY
uniref:Uncharacterized protein n=1 Tax=Oryza glumipatula TaxID=40148 RepID=A0A0E0AUR8_9ORYZ